MLAQRNEAKASQALLAAADQPALVTQQTAPQALPPPPVILPAYNSSQHAWARHLPAPQSSASGARRAYDMRIAARA